jgi:cell wall-associated NlpC family hydrolase
MSLRHSLWILAGGLALSACATANSARVPRPSPFPQPVDPPAVFHPSPAESAPQPPALTSFSTASFLAAAEKLRGVPYVLGGTSPTLGFDCSGYTQYVFGLYRIMLPRTVLEQYRIGKAVGKSVKAIKAGDLLFFRMAGPTSPVSHVALALGPTEFIHAPSTDGVVRSEHLTSPYWRSRFVAARRVL